MAVCLSSCFVKEDRTLCPCWLDVDISQMPGGRVSMGLIRGGEIRFQDLQQRQEPYEVTCSRDVEGVVFLGGKFRNPENGMLAIPEGEQADSVFACNMAVDARCERVHVKATGQRQFATISLTMEIPDGMAEYPFDIVVEGNSKGWNLPDMSAVPGRYRYEPARTGSDSFVFRVPRQCDSSLKIDMVCDGRKVDSVDIGKIIAQSGYDWSAPSLESIDMQINFTDEYCSISVSSWTESKIIELEI